MIDLPRGWVKARLRDLVKSPAGWSPRQATSKVFRYVDIEAVDNEAQRIASARELPVAEAPSRARVAIEKGDVLFSLVRPYLKNIARVPDDLHGQVASTAFVALRPESGISTDFVFYQLVQDSFIKSIPTYGNSPPAARDDEFLDLEVPVAPTREQTRIASKLEELLSDLHAGVLALERARANLKRYRAAVLKAAVEGRLTEKWRAAHPDVEPASKLLEHILAERRKRWEEAQIKKYADKGQSPPKGWEDRYPEPATPDSTELPKLPAEWCWATIDQLSNEVRNGSARAPTPSATGHRILRINAVRPMSVDLAETRLVDLPANEVEDALVRNEDLLFTRYNGSPELVGVAGLVRNLEGEILHPDKLIRVRVSGDESLGEFLELASNVGASRDHIRKRTRTTAGQAGVSGSDIKQTPIPLAPKAEIREIMTEASRSLSLILAAEKQVNLELRRSPRLRQAILKRAFEGKLVPQDPRDQPASELLEGIRAARVGEGKAKRRGRGGKGRTV